ncbi:hypothetical protein AC1031_005721 [Aphanomyces cochlioides]|nr:hypothetical protein AC1031_005721 [Aphanomyces cochlioides]
MNPCVLGHPCGRLSTPTSMKSLRPTRTSPWNCPLLTATCTFRLTIRVHRAFNVYIVVLFVGIWAVIGGIAYVGSMTIIWKTRAPDNPALFFSGLIAVPIFRNTAPGNPPYGTFASPSHC